VGVDWVRGKVEVCGDNVGAGDGVRNGLDNCIIGNALDNELGGGDGNDVVRGGDGNDLMYGGAGNDILDGGAGYDMMLGGTGNDLYVVDSSNDQVIENPGEGIDTVQQDFASYALPANVENLVLNLDAVTGVGNALDNTI